MLWALFWIAAYLLMIGVTRAVYAVAYPRIRSSTYDPGVFFGTILWPIGLPLIAGSMFGEYVRKCIDEVNREEEG